MTRRLENGILIELTQEELKEISERENSWNIYIEKSKRTKMTVTRFQALAALDAAGLLSQIEAIMDNPATPNITRLAWNNALEFKRLSPTVVALGATLGLTDEQLDALFTQAKNIEA